MTTDKLSAIEGNKIIAEFMGGVFDPEWTSEIYPTPCENIAFEVAPTPHSTYNWTPKNLQYHSSFDWLVPVWVKLINKPLEGVEDMGEVYKEMIATEWYQMAVQGLITGEITLVHGGIVEGIKWYNQNNK